MDQQDPLPCTLARSQPRWSSNRKDAQSWFGSAQGWYSFYFQGVLKQTSVNFRSMATPVLLVIFQYIKGMLYRGKSCSPENHRYWAVYKDSACHLCTKSQTSCKCSNVWISIYLSSFYVKIWCLPSNYGPMAFLWSPGGCCICWKIMPSMTRSHAFDFAVAVLLYSLWPGPDMANRTNWTAVPGWFTWWFRCFGFLDDHVISCHIMV